MQIGCVFKLLDRLSKESIEAQFALVIIYDEYTFGQV